MALVNFTYNEIEKSINNNINNELTLYEQFDSNDEQRLEMNALATSNNKNVSKLFDSEKQNDDNSYTNFDIKLKRPILILKCHSNSIGCAIVLNDGRLATCSNDQLIIIYNNKTFKPDLIIKEHTDFVIYILQLSSGMLASCSQDQTIKIYNIQYNNYELLQTLNYHTSKITKIIEMSNKKLVSCSQNSIIIYFKDNINKYKKDYQIKTNKICWSLIQTKENEICYGEDSHGDDSIIFFDLLEKKIINKINNLSIIGWNSFNMITKDLLLITGSDRLSIINVNQHNLVRIINVYNSGFITGSCLLNKNIVLTGDESKTIRQWEIVGDNLKLISIKENAHNYRINIIIKLGNGYILSGSRNDGIIKIW